MATRGLLLSVVLLASAAAVFLGAAHHCRYPGAGPAFLPPSFSAARKALLSSSLPVGPTTDDGPSPAPTCQTLACPPYKVAYNASDFEIRDYRGAAWAETEPLLDVSFNKAGATGFRRLFKYIQGDNMEGAQVPMTAPVLTTIKPSGGPFCSSTFTVKFFVPPEFSAKPPEPSAGSGVRIASLPRRCVAVRRFPGFATDFNVAEEASNLWKSLQGTAWSNITAVDLDETYSIAQYNSPFELFYRVNEVWVPFEGKDDCSPAEASSKAGSLLAQL